VNRCSICRHPELHEINVSVLRDGIRATARRYHISRPALGRHKGHLPTFLQSEVEIGGAPDPVPLRRTAEADCSSSKLGDLLRLCERNLLRALDGTNVSTVYKALKETRACLQLWAEVIPTTRTSVRATFTSADQISPKLGDDEVSIRTLQKVCGYTKGFDPLKLWQLRIVHDQVMDLVQARVSPQEIGQRLGAEMASGERPSLTKRVYGTVLAEEWLGREREVAQDIIRQILNGLIGYPKILEQLSNALAEYQIEPGMLRAEPIAYHHVGDLNRIVCLNSSYCLL